MAFLVGRLLDAAAAAVPDRVAASIEGEWISFRALDRSAGRLANALAGLGARRGDRILFWGTLSLRCHEIFFACARLGAAFSPVNPLGSIEEVRQVAEYLKPRMMVVDADHAAQGEAIARALHIDLVVIGMAGAAPGPNLDRAMERAAERYGGETPGEDDIHVIFLTSGSTGLPKGVMIPHRAGWLRAHSFETQMTSGGGGDVNMFPLFHMAGWTQITSSMIHLRANHLARRADADHILKEVERWRARRLYCLPGVWERVLECRQTFDLRSLRQVLTGTYRVDPRLMEALTARFPGALRQVVYGSTEAGIVLGLDDDEIDAHPDGVGLPVRGASARIAQDGELEVATDCMMAGYFELPDVTADVLRDGWYRTGDLAERHEDGCYRIVGRAREIIRSGGETIAPAEVEAALASFPGVRQVAIIGLPDARWGEIVCAALVMADGGVPPSSDQLRTYLKPRLASFKHPRAVVALDHVPTTAATQQLQRAAVREMVLARMARESI